MQEEEEKEWNCVAGANKTTSRMRYRLCWNLDSAKSFEMRKCGMRTDGRKRVAITGLV